MTWRLCLGPTDHWVVGEDDGSCVPGRRYPTACDDQVYVIGFGGADRRCDHCARLITAPVPARLPRRDPGVWLKLLRMGWPGE